MKSEIATIIWRGNRLNLIDPDGYKVASAKWEEYRELLREAEMMEYQIDWKRSEFPKNTSCQFGEKL